MKTSGRDTNERRVEETDDGRGHEGRKMKREGRETDEERRREADEGREKQTDEGRREDGRMTRGN